MYNLGVKIAKLRKEKFMTQTDLADALEVSTQAVSKWEVGSSYPDISLIPKLADILDTSTDYLLRDEEQPQVQMQKESTKKDISEMIFKIRVQDADGSKVKVNLPIGFFKLGFNIMDGVDFNGKVDKEVFKNIDFDSLIEMAEKGVIGHIVEVEDEDGSVVSIFIE